MGTACLVSCSVVTNSLFTTKHVFVPKLVCEIYYSMKVPPWISLSFLRSLTFSEASARSGPEKQRVDAQRHSEFSKFTPLYLGKYWKQNNQYPYNLNDNQRHKTGGPIKLKSSSGKAESLSPHSHISQVPMAELWCGWQMTHMGTKHVFKWPLGKIWFLTCYWELKHTEIRAWHIPGTWKA